MSVFVLGRAILLVGVWTRDLMSYFYVVKEGIESLILPSPVSLDGTNFVIKLAFNKLLKFCEALKKLEIYGAKDKSTQIYCNPQ